MDIIKLQHASGHCTNGTPFLMGVQETQCAPGKSSDQPLETKGTGLDSQWYLHSDRSHCSTFQRTLKEKRREKKEQEEDEEESSVQLRSNCTGRSVTRVTYMCNLQSDTSGHEQAIDKCQKFTHKFASRRRRGKEKKHNGSLLSGQRTKLSFCTTRKVLARQVQVSCLGKFLVPDCVKS